MQFILLAVATGIFLAAWLAVQMRAVPAVNSSGNFTEQVGVAGKLIYRTATADGTTTGTIPATGGMDLTVIVTSGNNDHIVILPPPIVGMRITLIGANIYELRSSAPATIGINGGTGSGKESAIPAATTAVLICETLTNWKGFQMSSTAGTLAAVEVAA